MKFVANLRIGWFVCFGADKGGRVCCCVKNMKRSNNLEASSTSSQSLKMYHISLKGTSICVAKTTLSHFEDIFPKFGVSKCHSYHRHICVYRKTNFLTFWRFSEIDFEVFYFFGIFLLCFFLSQKSTIETVKAGNIKRSNGGKEQYV